MVFASLYFILKFLPFFLAGYFLMPGLRAKNLYLTIASYLFYGYFRLDFAVLMLFSTVVDYVCSRKLGASPVAEFATAEEESARTSWKRKRWLVLSLCTNLGLLGWFKYANLAVQSYFDLGGPEFEWEAIILPLGISFYTFQSMSYSIDVYRGHVKPVRSALDLACYVSMFPQLVAGPIVRYREIQEQIVERRHRLSRFGEGALGFLIGFSKKVLIADNASLLVAPVFDQGEHGLLAAWIATAAYAIQIYFDFSGYTDMAVGLGRMMGFEFPQNFRSPYRSNSITEFWRRWHMSLSSWLRDYLYVSLGGNRRGKVRTYFNLAATMLLGGLWHGASWTYLLWGGYQGAFLVIERLFGKKSPWELFGKTASIGITFVLVLFGWAIFRADSIDRLGTVWGGLLGLHGVGEFAWPDQFREHAVLALCLGLILCFVARRTEQLIEAFRPSTLVWATLAFLFSLGQLSVRDFSPFIYFQF
ncbi:MAG: MBOAT family O-acyltransferase [Planctomycetota bacterium]